MSVWRKRCQRVIAELVKDLPETATLEERRKALWGNGFAAHQGTRWGRKMWGSEVRKYLARYGDATAAQTRRYYSFPDHVHFPFREGGDG